MKYNLPLEFHSN